MRVFVLCAALALSGCAGLSEAMKYSDIEIQYVRNANDEFRIFDKPAEGKLMITASLGKAANQGAASGFTFGLADARMPKGYYTEAVLQFFAQTGRPNCQIVDGYLLIEPQWEYIYRCPAS